jgi:large subunit ribosomal protein L10
MLYWHAPKEGRFFCAIFYLRNIFNRNTNQRKEQAVPVSKQEKEVKLAELVELLKESDGFAIIRTQGMSVSKVEGVRKRIRDAGGQYVVTKNTLITKALEQVGWNVPVDQLKGPTAIAFGKTNFPGVAKAVLSYIKEESPDPTVFNAIGGVMSGKDVLNASRLEAVSNLPTLDEIRAQLAGLIVAPATGLVTVLDAANGQIVNVIQALLDDKKAS